MLAEFAIRAGAEYRFGTQAEVRQFAQTAHSQPVVHADERVEELRIASPVDVAVQSQAFFFSHASPSIWKPRTFANTGCSQTWT